MKTINPERTRCPYDVGDVLITASSAQPSTRWPGTTWSQIKDCFLLAAGDNPPAGETGGAEKQTISQENLPNVNFALSGWTVNWGNPSSGSVRFVTQTGGAVQAEAGAPSSSLNQLGVSGNTAKSGGSSTPLNMMPPYTAFYMWQRTK